MRNARGIATDEELLAATPGRPDAFAAFYRRALKRSKGVVRGPARLERSFFEMLEADLVQAATLLSGAHPALSEPPRRRLRWRP